VFHDEKSGIRRFTKMRAKRDVGFTLIELLVVVVIIGVLAAVAIPMYTKHIKDARTAEAMSRLDAILTASKTYHQRFGEWPSEPGSADYFADFSSTEHFTYSLTKGGGTGEFELQAEGRDVHGMGDVSVIMSCANVNSEAIIQINL
jgi:prepilin-type N-terminal cleavage/methylation domain-containing protein